MKNTLTLSRLIAVIAVFVIGSSLHSNAQILTQPKNVSLCSGATGNVTFSITTDFGIYSYQWQAYNRKTGLWEDLSNTSIGVIISGVTTKSLNFAFNTTYRITSTYNGMQVRCRVSERAGVVYSRTGTATVLIGAAIATSPAAATKIVGESVTFSVTTTGSSPSYQWQKNSLNIIGANSSSYTIAAVALGDAANYRCYVYNDCGAEYSSSVYLTVWPPLAITNQPAPVSACEGTTGKSFSVVATGNGLSYQWQSKFKLLDWTNIPGAVSNIYALAALSTSGISYRCVVTGNGGQTITSNTALLTVYANPSVSGSPTNVTLMVGGSITFSVSATGYSLQYQWRKGGVDISGANSSTYTIPVLLSTDGGDYTCKVSNTCNTVGIIGPVNTLTVETPAPDAWFEQTTPTSNDIRKISVISAEVAYAIVYNSGSPGQLLKTINKGINWNSVTTGVTNWNAIDFVDQNTGFVAGSYKILKTINGGTDWTPYDLRTDLSFTDYPTINDIQMISTTVGWAVGSYGLILKTENGGTTWIKKNYGGVPIDKVDISLNSVFFLNASVGYIAGANGVIIETTDGGLNWTILTTGSTTHQFKDIEFSNSLIGFAVAANNGTLKTTDGGDTWTALNTGVSNFYANSVDFIDANNGYLGGYYHNGSAYVGTILKTNNGGVNWYRQTVAAASYVNHLEMSDSQNGFAVNQGGIIQRTAKGGCRTPGINLGADQTVCAGTNVLLTANSNANNANCQYVWTPGNISNSGTYSVTATNTYGVTATNECGMTATDNALITFNALPLVSAGKDTSICEGQNTQLYATGAESYLWNNSAFLDNGAIPNPITNTSITRTFTVTGTDINGCSASDAVIVTVNPIPSSSFDAPVFVCNAITGLFSYTGSSNGSSEFTWDFDGGILQSGSGSGPYVIKWTEVGDKTVSLAVTENGCISPGTVHIVNVRETPTSTFETPSTVCGNNAISLFYTGNAPAIGADYNWELGVDGTILDGTGQGPILASWSTKGTKNVSLSVTNDECTSTTTEQNVLVAYPYEGSEICMVTIDEETERNMVVWLKTPDVGIESYNIYREKLNVFDEYELIGNVSIKDLSVFVDTSSRPSDRQYLYKIAAVDTCDNISSLSNYHKTMLLQWSKNELAVNLTWFKYEIEGINTNTVFPSYKLWRGPNSGSLEEIQTISSSVSAINDSDPAALVSKMYYRVAAVRNAECAPAASGKKTSSGPFVHSLSNLEDNRLQGTGVSTLLADAMDLSVYPNPFTSQTSIKYTLQKQSKMKVEIYNIVGEKIHVILDETQLAGSHKLEMKASDVNYIDGLYYLRITVDDVVIIRKTMLTR